MTRKVSVFHVYHRTTGRDYVPKIHGKQVGTNNALGALLSTDSLVYHACGDWIQELPIIVGYTGIGRPCDLVFTKWRPCPWTHSRDKTLDHVSLSGAGNI